MPCYNSFMEVFEIVKLEPSEWQMYKELRLKALRDSPQAFLSTYEESVKIPDEKWQFRLQEAKEGETGWLMFARNKEKLVGMMGAFRKEVSDIATIVGVYVIRKERGKGIAKKLINQKSHFIC